MNYPYMIIMRNEPSGMIWQAYTVRDAVEETLLTKTARHNGFIVEREELGYTTETFSGWREDACWKEYRAAKGHLCES